MSSLAIELTSPEDWCAGAHHGTIAGPRGLALVPGVSRGWWGLTVSGSFPRLVASLNPDPWKVGCGIRLSVRARGSEVWSSLGVYGSGPDLPKSEAGPGVEADLLRLPADAQELELKLELEAGELGDSPGLRRLALVGWDPRAPRQERRPLTSVWGTTLDVAPRSQRVLGEDLAERACSPTSLAMLLAYWGHDQPTAEVAAAVYDHGAGIYGNWSFNVAYAATFGLTTTVARLEGLRDLEEEVQAGRPVVISHRYAAGELSQTPLPETQGHLIVVGGFTEQGDVVVLDPAADPRQDEAIRRVYRRDELRRTWLENADGIAYLCAGDPAGGS